MIFGPITVKFDGSVGFSERVLGDALVRTEIVLAHLTNLKTHINSIRVVR